MMIAIVLTIAGLVIGLALIIRDLESTHAQGVAQREAIADDYVRSAEDRMARWAQDDERDGWEDSE